mmetsp:Transcript_104665/g.233649  ORF Transcript_104665/g.233649 Transcript_104665/m.233649 type:complete len:240 (-) Transcript_104665:19-738(-)
MRSEIHLAFPHHLLQRASQKPTVGCICIHREAVRRKLIQARLYRQRDREEIVHHRPNDGEEQHTQVDLRFGHEEGFADRWRCQELPQSEEHHEGVGDAERQLCVDVVQAVVADLMPEHRYDLTLLHKGEQCVKKAYSAEATEACTKRITVSTPCGAVDDKNAGPMVPQLFGQGQQIGPQGAHIHAGRGQLTLTRYGTPHQGVIGTVSSTASNNLGLRHPLGQHPLHRGSIGIWPRIQGR